MADPASPSDASSSRSAVPALQRGRACLRCRKRKMRCDGGKPACQQCTKAKKGAHCEYDDGKGKTRTQILRENVARLEARVRELEGSSSAQPSVQLFDPHVFADATFPDASTFAYSGDSSSPSSSGSPTSLPFAAPGTPSSYPFSPSPVSMASGMVSGFSQGTSSPTPSLSTPPAGVPWLSSGRTTPESPARAGLSDAVPVELAHTLLDIVIPQASQVGLVLHPERLRASLLLSPEEQRHPVLLNAIFLWACALSRPQSLSRHESLYFARAVDAFADAPRRLTKVVDVVQGASLLALYLLTSGRLSEGSYYLSAAASLALQWGLHRATNAASTHESPIALDPAFVLPPPADAIEAGERALTFWHVFFLDAAWSPALQRPRTIGDAPGALGAVTVPWPQDMSDYETGNFATLGDGATVHAFLAPQNHVSAFAGGFSSAALRAKAAALLDAATALSASWDTGLQSMLDEPAQATRTDALEGMIGAFEGALLPLSQLQAVREQDRAPLLETHALVAYARIQMHFARAGAGDARAHEACILAARAGVYVARAASDAEEADMLDPIVGSCFAACASVLAREISRVEAWAAVSSSDARVQVSTLLGAMSRLNVRFPLIGFQIARIQRMIPNI